jgi:hypothetical protein
VNHLLANRHDVPNLQDTSLDLGTVNGMPPARTPTLALTVRPIHLKQALNPQLSLGLDGKQAIDNEYRAPAQPSTLTVDR